MTPEERARLVACEATGPVRVTRYACDELEAVVAFHIREAVAAERERCAKAAEESECVCAMACQCHVLVARIRGGGG
jgi:hypothetical protein